MPVDGSAVGTLCFVTDKSFLPSFPLPNGCLVAKGGRDAKNASATARAVGSTHHDAAQPGAEHAPALRLPTSDGGAAR